MSGTPRGWFWTITRPASHLVSTILVFGIIIAATVLSVSFPQWGWVFFVIALIPAAAWYVAMMRAFRRNRQGADGAART